VVSARSGDRLDRLPHGDWTDKKTRFTPLVVGGGSYRRRTLTWCKHMLLTHIYTTAALD